MDRRVLQKQPFLLVELGAKLVVSKTMQLQTYKWWESPGTLVGDC